MLRIVVQNSDCGMAANIGGHVEVSVRSFDIEAPELEAHLREHEDHKTETERKYAARNVIGVELLPNKELSNAGAVITSIGELIEGIREAWMIFDTVEGNSAADTWQDAWADVVFANAGNTGGKDEAQRKENDDGNL